MLRAQMEAWASEALERLVAGKLTEDDYVEVKRELPRPPAKAARRLAAMLNAARGSRVLYLIGVDEHTHEAVGGDFELAAWRNEVFSCLDGPPPSMETFHLRDGVMALSFEPLDPPYVVKVRHREGVKDIPTYEVPWRDASHTRSAMRADLIKLLVPVLQAPEIEVLAANVTLDVNPNPRGWVLAGHLEVFITPMTRDRLTLPAHRTSIEILPVDGSSLELPEVHVTFSHSHGSLAQVTSAGQIYCDAAGPATLNFRSFGVDAEHLRKHDRLVIAGALRPAPEGPPGRFRTEVHSWMEAAETRRWRKAR